MSELACYQIAGDALRRFGSSERFNRVLYGGHAGDASVGRFFTFAGDTPIFMGAQSDFLKHTWCYQAKNGILQSGLALTPGFAEMGAHDLYSSWFHQASDIVTTWHHGYLSYDLTRFSPYFPDARVHIEVYPLQDHDGFLVHYEIAADGRVIFCAALGGITSFIGRFDQPEAENRNFALSDCDGNQAAVADGVGRIADASGATELLVGTDFGAELSTDAAAALNEKYPSLALSEHSGPAAAVKLVRVILPGEELNGNLVVLRNGSPEILRQYLAADGRGELVRKIRAKHEMVSFHTPDDRLDQSVPDTLIALDASWHEPTFYHGAVGYHAPFLGWRGYYGPTLAGWSERVRTAIRAHLATLTRAEGPERVWYDGADRPDLDHEGTQYHHLENSSGKLTALLHREDIYDMQEVSLDMIFHYLERTGDLALGAEIFEPLAAVLAWEERILDPDGDGLYQNFLNTWISDGHVYNGGGCAQASCYNYAANCAMVRLGRALGRDTAVFAGRAAGIKAAMERHLWLEKEGLYAEYVDTVGNKLIHPSPELSTLYLAVECGVPNPVQAVRLLEFSERAIKNIVTLNRRGRLAFSANWLPKKYSTCGIFPAENAALALAYFRAFRRDKALKILDGLLDAFALSHSPGALSHVLSAHASNDDGDWDFTDVTSMYFRLLVEGLWGIRFQRLSGEIAIAPQLPEAWHQAELAIPGLKLAFRREAGSARLTIETSLPERKIVTLTGDIADLCLNGMPLKAEKTDYAGVPLTVATVETCGRFELAYRPGKAVAPPEFAAEPPPRNQAAHLPAPEAARQEAVALDGRFNAEIIHLFDREYRAPRPEGYSIGARRNGRYAWEWNHFGHNAVVVDDGGLRHSGGVYRLASGWRFPTPETGDNALCVSVWDNFPTVAAIPLTGRGREVAVFLIGATNAMQNGVVNARLTIVYADGSETAVDLVHPDNFDDFLVPALQPANECFYFSAGCHGIVQRIPVVPERELRELRVEAVANEVIVGILGVVCVR